MGFFLSAQQGAVLKRQVSLEVLIKGGQKKVSTHKKKKEQQSS